jgi:signal transduction histidine kinase
LVEALAGSAEAGVVAENPGGVVTQVAIGGFGWTDGIRPGQTVVALHAADEPGGWLIQTRPSSGADEAVLTSSQDLHTAALRASWPLAAAALGFAVLALASVTTRRRRAELLASLALVICAIPTELRGHPILAPVGAAMALITPGIWVARWARLPRIVRVAAASIPIVTVVVWAWARMASPALYGAIDSVRVGVGYVLVLAVVVVGPGLISSRWVRSARSLRALDVAAASTLVALLAALQFLGSTPLPIVVMVGLLLIGLYSTWRGWALRTVDRLLLGDLRERASLEAIENERSRLARDLHDEPLQQLAGVIKRLEARPETSDESDMLRDVADQLRAVATDLHPPVLDDLGLVPAIEFISARQHPLTKVQVDVRADAGYLAVGRPSPAVELAIFRIVQEALSNAATHSDCGSVRIFGHVSSEQIELSVADDGVGLDPRVITQAMRDGRLGLASMRRRAEAIDGDLTIIGTPNLGTTVTVRWSA